MNHSHKLLIEDLRRKNKKKSTSENIKTFCVLVSICFFLYLLHKYYNHNSIGYLILFMLGIICFIVAIKNIKLQKEIMNWNETECMILEKRYSYTPIIYFVYSINGTEYASNKAHITIESSVLFKDWKPLDKKYSVGCNYKCYVNPHNNEQAVLDKSIDKVFFCFYSFFGCFWWGSTVYSLLR